MKQFGTLTDVAYAITKTFAFTYDFTASIKSARKLDITEPGLRWAYVMTAMLDDFTQMLESNEFNSIYTDDIFVEPDWDNLEDHKEWYPVYVKELCDEDDYIGVHPEAIAILYERLETEIVLAACEGHYDFLYEMDEPRNLHITTLPNGTQIII